MATKTLLKNVNVLPSMGLLQETAHRKHFHISFERFTADLSYRLTIFGYFYDPELRLAWKVIII